ncbi:MAG: hypothetical protein PUC00_09085 [Clostridiales bacterium]|nr:hypothetical protein [Clostridiales bacterium]
MAYVSPLGALLSKRFLPTIYSGVLQDAYIFIASSAVVFCQGKCYNHPIGSMPASRI